MTFLKIVDYGEYPHAKGLQRVTYPVAQRLERHFNSLRGRLARHFGGLPVYVGHPDDPDFVRQPGHDDTRAHGWVQSLEARPDGLYGTVKWAATGREMVDNAHYKFLSPRWAMKHVGDATFEPVRLLSIGLTNTPNIPGEAIANQAPFTADGAGEAAVDAEPLPAKDTVIQRDHVLGAEASAPSTPPKVAASITANNTLVTRAPLSCGLGERRDAFSRRAAIVDAVNARMADTGEDYASAWSNLKRCRPDLF